MVPLVRAERVAAETCERLVIRRPHHASLAQNHAGIKTTPPGLMVVANTVAAASFTGAQRSLLTNVGIVMNLK